MDTPAALIAHYSSLAFYTRLAALTFVGAIIGTMVEKLEKPEVSHVVGLAVLLVVASLGELNRRYTHAYLAALHAASRRLKDDSPEGDLASRRWRVFRRTDELGWPSVRSR